MLVSLEIVSMIIIYDQFFSMYFTKNVGKVNVYTHMIDAWINFTGVHEYEIVDTCFIMPIR